MKCTRFLALLLALTFALCVLAACGKEDNANNADNAGVEKGYRLLSKAQWGDQREASNAEFLYEHRGEDIVITCSIEGSPRKAWTVNKAGYVIASARIDPDGSEHDRYETDYDENGRRTTDREYKRGKLESSTVYEYDGTGRLAKASEYDEDGQLKYYTVYLYDAAGNRVDFTTYSADGSVGRYQYDYNADGSVSMGGFAEPTDKVFERDGDGKLIKLTFLARGDVSEVYTYEYDGEGRLTKVTRRDRDGEFPYREYAYGADGKLAKEVLYNWDGSVSRVAYTYDGAGRLTNRTDLDADGGLNSRYLYVYGEDGTLTKETVDYYNGGEEKEYDANGNLTRSFSYGSDKSDPYGFVLEYLDSCVSKYTYYRSDGSIRETIEVTEFTEVSMTEAQYQGICRLFHQDGVLYR
ncbi:MAG: RHS repeat protein [Oscillospiraceae bacterium]|nr:RHS repeat protein [Oscillospiraceae bacterium]